MLNHNNFLERLRRLCGKLSTLNCCNQPLMELFSTIGTEFTFTTEVAVFESCSTYIAEQSHVVVNKSSEHNNKVADHVDLHQDLQFGHREKRKICRDCWYYLSILNVSSLYQVCGIGNGGVQYRNNRHSVGHIMINALRAHLNYPVWTKDNKVGGYWSIGGQCVLFRSNFWMNQVGKVVSKAYTKMGGEDWGKLCVIFDDLELPVGVAKLRTMGMGK
jgi:hypothetical protein